MTSVVPVKFAYAVRDLWFDQARSYAQEGDHVICTTERGTEIGLVTAPAKEVSDEELAQKIGNSVLKPVLRVANDNDLARAEELAQMGDDAFPLFRELVAASGLDMKPVGVEYLFGGEKVVCYFAAEERVDFRQLVRDLSHELRQRIDMRQIGVREEAAVVGGFGHCGQELCCARFGLSFEPVSIRMAKEQDLPLTSNKISGACGRLMCCLRYEFEAYRDFKGRAPKRNAVIDTPLGKAKVAEYDTPKEQLALRLENGKIVRIPLAEMKVSEAARKKSEDLHCPCRPDTVVRASLDKLNSPDVQMALAELDRKNGVVPEEVFDESDIFVEPKTRKKRVRRSAAARPTESASAQKAQTQGQADTSSAAGESAEKKSRRRRRKRTNANAVATQPQQTAAEAPKKANAADQQPEKQETRRRRRHRTTSGDAAAPKAQQNQEQQPPKHRRRPGDRGGQKPAQQQQQQAQRRPPQHMQKPKDAASGEEATAPKRRRRRRRGGNNKPAGDSPTQQ